MKWFAFLLLILALAIGLFPPDANAQCYSNGYCPPTSYGYSGYSAPTYSSYSNWWYTCWPKNHAYYYKVRWAYDCHGGKQLQHDGNLYCQYWNGHCYAYRFHGYIPTETVATSYSYPVEKVVVKEIPVLVAPQQVGTTVYGGVPLALKGVLTQEPVTSLGDLIRDKQPGDDLAFLKEMAITTKIMSDGAVKIALGQQELQKQRNAGDAEVARIVAQAAAAENIAVKALQQASALGSQSLLNGDATLSGQGADALSVIINNRCVSCHGGEKGVAGGIDFNKADSFTDEQKLAIYGAVASKEMPKNGPALDKNQIGLFKAWVLGETKK